MRVAEKLTDKSLSRFRNLNEKKNVKDTV